VLLGLSRNAVQESFCFFVFNISVVMFRSIIVSLVIRVNFPIIGFIQPLQLAFLGLFNQLCSLFNEVKQVVIASAALLVRYIFIGSALKVLVRSANMQKPILTQKVAVLF
jgi:hypothetical protein